MKIIRLLFLIFSTFATAATLAELIDLESGDVTEDSIEVIPWDLAPGEDIDEEEDEDEKIEQPVQEYNVNININENQQQPFYYGPYYFPGRRHRHTTPDDVPAPWKPSKTESLRHPWMPAGRPARR